MHPEFLYRIALKGETEKVGEKDAGRDECDECRADPEFGSPLKYTPIKEQDADLDGEDARRPYQHVHPENLVRMVSPLQF